MNKKLNEAGEYAHSTGKQAVYVARTWGRSKEREARNEIGQVTQ
jgi:hypothetical protein